MENKSREEEIESKIMAVLNYKNDNPVEYVWHLYNTDNGIYKDIFAKCGLTKFDVQKAVDLFLNSSIYHGIFSFSESVYVHYILCHLKCMPTKTGLIKKEQAALKELLDKIK